ncbi:hypothetical protein TEA_021614 [Camellia sinensis var. sinensis]|uniref:Uncharacterized protein n=1 Tax=Camellia sinensis var. sinensis TaxID=542762 RepID=A0A4S4ENN7_CAMSN|nr:hypothetical protein TEA_021614 [Camellia sinensis var. sinensis]
MVAPFPFSLTTLFFLILFLFMLVKQWIRPKTRTTIRNLPPGPWKLPLIGNIHQLSSLPHRSLQDLATKHGPLMHLQLGEVSAVVISSPRLAKMVMTTHDLALANRPRLLVAETLLYCSDIGFSPYGGYLRQMRKICTEELLSASKVRYFRGIRENEVSDLIEYIKLSSGVPVNLSEKLYDLTSNITCKAAVGKKCRDQEVLMELMKDTTSLAGGFDLADLFPSIKLLHVVSGMKPKLMKMHRKIDDVLESIIRERRMASTEESEQRDEDLLDVLLRLEKTGGLQFPITDDNIKAIIFDMFTGSTETSSTTVEWAMAELMKNPIVMKKAQAELRQSLLKLNEKRRFPHETRIQKLTYLKMVIKETLRLHPPSPLLLPRESREPCNIDGYNIPANTQVLVNAWALGRDHQLCWDADLHAGEIRTQFH